MFCDRYRGEAGPHDLWTAEPDTAGAGHHRPGPGGHRCQNSGAGAPAPDVRLQRLHQPPEKLRRLQDEADVPREYGQGGVKNKGNRLLPRNTRNTGGGIEPKSTLGEVITDELLDIYG